MNSSASRRSSGSPTPQTKEAVFSIPAVEAQLEKIVGSIAFRGSDSLKRFLRYVVEQTLQGQGDQLKEYPIGVDVLERPPSFDPRLDPAVRMAARRLRGKLEEYYAVEGRQDQILIDVPKGGYSATFAAQGPRGDSLGRPSATHLRRMVAVAGGGILVIAIAMFAAHRIRAKTQTAPALRRSVAVLGFDNLSRRSDKAWLSTALSEMLTTELASGEQLRLVPGEVVAQTKISLSLPDADSYGSETLAKVRQAINADDVVVGSYVLLGADQIRLDLRLQDTVAGETLASVSEKGNEGEIDDMVGRAGEKLRARLRVGELSAAEAATVKAASPSNRDALRQYAEGLASLRSLDNLKARDALLKCVKLEPNFAPAHAALASAWANLGYDSLASEEAQKAFALSAGLSNEQQLWIEGHYHEMAGDLDKAVSTYQNLFQAFPDNVEYGLRLAYVQYHAGKGLDALATIAGLRRFPAPIRDDPRLDLREADAYFSLGDYKRYQMASAQSAAKAKAQGSRLLAAQALADDCWALKILGQPKEAIATCNESQHIFSEAGDRGFEAAVLSQLGVIMQEQGDLLAAKSKIEQALAISRQLGDRDSTASQLGNLANIANAQGDLSNAKELYEQVLAIFREVGDKSGASQALNDIGRTDTRLGDFSAARSSLNEALDVTRQTGDKGQGAYVLTNLADLLYAQGSLKDAVGLLQQADIDLRQAGDKKGEADTLSVWGRVLFALGDLPGAEEKYRQGLQLRNEIGAKEDIAHSQVALAEIAVEEGRPKDAEVPCRQALEQFRFEHALDSEVMTETVLARALLTMGRTTEASQEIVEVRPLVAKSQSLENHLRMKIVEARLLAVLGHPKEAEQYLQSVLAQAGKHNFAPFRFESQLVLGEFETESGNTAVGLSRLAALKKDAEKEGFVLVASKAAAASLRVPVRAARRHRAHAS